MEDNMASLNCPDCQLQMLQQQSQLPTTNSLGTNILDQFESQQSQEHSRISSDTLASLNQFSQETMPSHYQTAIGSHSRAISSSNCMNMYSSFAKETNNFQHSSTVTSLNSSNSNSAASVGVGMSISMTSSTIPSHGCDLTINTSTTNGSMESCDYNGYCSTCGVLPNSTNDKFYRSNSRSHVFPPIFYSQGPPSSVIPCFSPIPDCNPWSNEYNPFAYATSYSQPVPSSDYYGSSVNIPGTTSINAFETTNQVTSSQNVVPLSYSIPSSNCNNSDNRIRNDLIATVNGIQHNQTSQSDNQSCPSIDNKVQNTIEISSRSCPLDDSDNESSCESDLDDSSILSEDRELISVVEDEEEVGENINCCESFVHTGNSNRLSSNHPKCFVCQSLIEIAECSSPQLAKMLENLDEDITVEDLDVSSGDIEIGGIEDEVKAFTIQQKKTNQVSQGVTFSRLTNLLGNLTKNPGNHFHSSTDYVPLCCRCGKLTSLADSLETQMTGILNILNKLLSISQSSIQTINPSDSPNFQLQPYCNSPFQTNLVAKCTESIGTQTENDSNFENSLYTQITESRSLKGITSNSFDNKVGNLHKDYCNKIDSEQQKTFNDEVKVVINNQVLRTDIITNDALVTKDFCENEKSSEYLNEKSSEYLNEKSSEYLNEKSSEYLNEKSSEYLNEKSSEYLNEKSSEYPNQKDSNILNSSVNIEYESIKPSSWITNEQISKEINRNTSPNPSISTDTMTINTNPETVFESNGLEGRIKVATNLSIIGESCMSINNLTIDPKLCSFCKRKFTTNSNLQAHTEICKFKLNHKSNNELKVDKKNMKCTKCGIGFRSSFRWRKHVEQGCQTVFECSFCSQRFSKNSELKAHASIHSKMKLYKCNVCDATFSTKGNQIAHTRIHSSNKKYICSQCDKGFNRRYALTIHQNRHKGIKLFACPICDKNFADPSNLNNHKKRSHQNIEINFLE